MALGVSAPERPDGMVSSSSERASGRRMAAFLSRLLRCEVLKSAGLSAFCNGALYFARERPAVELRIRRASHLTPVRRSLPSRKCPLEETMRHGVLILNWWIVLAGCSASNESSGSASYLKPA